MRAPPEQETMMTGRRAFQREFDSTHDLFADDHAHRPADEAVVHRGDDGWRALQLADAHDHGIGLAGAGNGLCQALAVGLGIGEGQRIVRAELGRQLLPALVIEQRLQPVDRAQAEVMAALVAHLQVLDEILRVEDGVAAGALLPQAFGDAAGRLRRRKRPARLFEPGHKGQLSKFKVQSAKFTGRCRAPGAEGRVHRLNFELVSNLPRAT